MQVSDSLADQALSNLVNQFARPLDFLRELVQNSIDAGSPRVDIWVRWRQGGDQHGVLEIHVEDSGEGMDERIIDDHLTRLFSSSKEDDLTKIGKFGIGFTSIFAIQPQAVLLRTGRHGESWELLFHPDRSFDKVRLEAPVSGTRITLFKRMHQDRVEAFVRDARWILGWWCEHSDTPVSFWDRSQESTSPPEVSSDPFAAFAEPTSGAVLRQAEQVNRPLDLQDCLITQSHTQGSVQVIVGTGPRPRYAFYNGGLTLLNSTDDQVLGGYKPRLGHLVFKLKCDALEHTLTRDNVIQDQHWSKAMKVLKQAADALRDALLERCSQVALAGGELAAKELSELHRALCAEVRAPGGRQMMARHRMLPLFLDSHGRALSLAQIETQESSQGAVLLSTPDARLAQALEETQVHLVAGGESTQALLMAAWQAPFFASWASERRLVPAHTLYLLPDPTSEGLLDDRERLVFGELRRLLLGAVGERLRLLVGDFGGPQSGAQGPIALEGPGDGQVFQRPEARWLRIPTFLRGRSVLLNRYHPTVRLFVTAGAEQLDLAAFGLAQLILHQDGLESEAVYERLLEQALARAEGGA